MTALTKSPWPPLPCSTRCPVSKSRCTTPPRSPPWSCPQTCAQMARSWVWSQWVRWVENGTITATPCPESLGWAPVPHWATWEDASPSLIQVTCVSRSGSISWKLNHVNTDLWQFLHIRCESVGSTWNDPPGKVLWDVPYCQQVGQNDVSNLHLIHLLLLPEQTWQLEVLI